MLVLIRAGEQAPACNLDAPKVTVGRDISNDFVLNEASVSGFHALMLREHGRSIIADLGSTNGCFINGQRIADRAEFSAGDKLGLGSVNFEVGVAAPLPETTVAMPTLPADSVRQEAFFSQTSAPPVSPVGDKFCSQCGARADADASFCVRCGKHFPDAPNTARSGAGEYAGFAVSPDNFGAATGSPRSPQKSKQKWVWMGLASTVASAAAVTGGWLLLNKPSDETTGQKSPVIQERQSSTATPVQAVPVNESVPPQPAVSSQAKATSPPRSVPLTAAVAPPPLMLSPELTEEAYSTPPPLALASAPEFIVAPSDNEYIYMAAGLTGLYFLGGQWYRHHNGHWFRSPDYNGRWSHLNRSFVPPAILRVPPEYPRHIPPNHQHVPYADLNHSWRHWDQQKHWNSQSWYRNELRDDVRKDRIRNIERERAERERHKPASVPPRFAPPAAMPAPAQHAPTPPNQPNQPNQPRPQTHGVPSTLPAPHSPQGQPPAHLPQPHPATMPPPLRPHNQAQPRPVSSPTPPTPAMSQPPRPQSQPTPPHPQSRPAPPPVPERAHSQPASHQTPHQAPPPAAALPPLSRPQNHQGLNERRHGEFRDRH